MLIKAIWKMPQAAQVVQASMQSFVGDESCGADGADCAKDTVCWFALIKDIPVCEKSRNQSNCSARVFGKAGSKTLPAGNLIVWISNGL